MKPPDCFGHISVVQGSRCAECGIFPECSYRMQSHTGFGVLPWPRMRAEETRERVTSVLVEKIDQQTYAKVTAAIKEKTSLHETRGKVWKFVYRRNGKRKAIEVLRVEQARPNELHASFPWTPIDLMSGMRIEGIMIRPHGNTGTYVVAESPEAFVAALERVIPAVYLA